MVNKREDYLSWNDYFMGIADLSAQRSKDPKTQVGCCIVNPDNNHILSIGYNGLPLGFDDNDFNWSKSENFLENKHTYIVHAEANAILNANQNLEKSIAYVTMFPCNECAKLIIQSGIKEVVYLEDKYHERESFVASRRMFDSSGVVYRQLDKVEVTLT